MSRDYTNLPAAIRDETLESLRQQVKAATDNAADHRISAKHHQEIADRETGYAERDEERARQWQAQLDFAEQQAARDADPATEAFVDVADAEGDQLRGDYANSAEGEAEPPSVADMRAIFGEPVEGRDYDVMPSQDAKAKSVGEIEREIAIEAGDDDEDGEL